MNCCPSRSAVVGKLLIDASNGPQKGEAMKKVRALATATIPALGMMFLPATVAHAVSNRKASIRPAITCGTSYTNYDTSSGGQFQVQVGYRAANKCVGKAIDLLDLQKTGLGAGLIYYSADGGIEASHYYDDINERSGRTWVSAHPDIAAYDVLGWLGANNNSHQIHYGPVSVPV
jgi:hypothetical protein